MSRIVLTDGTTPADVSSGNTQVYTKSGGAPGTDGLYYKQGSDPEVGPLATAGTVTDLQTAYDGGNTIDITAAEGRVEISNSTDATDNLYLERTFAGSGNALSIEMGATTTKSAIYILQLGIGGGIEVGLPNTNSASGFYVEHGDSSSTGDGIQVIQKGTGEGVQIGHTGLSGNGLNVELSDGSNIDHAIQASHVGNGSNLHLVRTSGLGDLISSDPSVFKVDNAGNTTTPSVIFDNSRITIEGDSGVAGEPFNPRISLTSGGAYRGALSRVYHFYSKGVGAPATLDLDSVSEIPTVFSLESYSGWTIKLPEASKYKNGEEIIVLNIDLAGSFDVASDVGRDIQSVDSTPIPTVTISGGAGRRFMAWVNDSSNVAENGTSVWVVTGVI